MLNRKLIAIPALGLCNRLRVLGHLHYYAQITFREFQVHWQPDRHCSATFDYLFEPQPFLIHRLEASSTELYDFLPEGDELPSKRRGINFLTPASTLAIRTAWLPRQKGVRIKWSHRVNLFVWSKATGFLSSLQPISSVRRKLAKYDLQNCVGVQIRRRDYSASSIDHAYAENFEKIPLDSFKKAMNKEIEADPSIRFILATNLESVENDFQNTYGERLILQKKQSYLREDPRAIQDALVDLLLLSKTRRIIGTPTSTFGKLAAELGNIPFVSPENPIR